MYFELVIKDFTHNKQIPLGPLYAWFAVTISIILFMRQYHLVLHRSVFRGKEHWCQVTVICQTLLMVSVAYSQGQMDTGGLDKEYASSHAVAYAGFLNGGGFSDVTS